MPRNTLMRSVCLGVAMLAAFAPCVYSADAHLANAPANNGQHTQDAIFTFNEFLVPQSKFTLPFYLFNAHILIDGAVNGKPGKFMFDTGTEFAFFLNNHFLPLSKDQFIGQGHAGSGQEMLLYRQNTPVDSLEIAGQIRFENVADFLHTDWGFIEQAYTPNFLGSIGHGFNRNYVFVIDYDAQTLTFHALNQDEAAIASIIDPARLVAILHFTPKGVDGKMPEVEMRIGKETLNVFFDTGSQGALELTETMKNRLEDQGKLSLSLSQYLYGTYETHLRASLTGLSYDAKNLQEARNLSFKIGTQNRVGLGYHFLKNYVSVWDYKHSTLTLLKP